MITETSSLLREDLEKGGKSNLLNLRENKHSHTQNRKIFFKSNACLANLSEVRGSETRLLRNRGKVIPLHCTNSTTTYTESHHSAVKKKIFEGVDTTCILTVIRTRQHSDFLSKNF